MFEKSTRHFYTPSRNIYTPDDEPADMFYLIPVELKMAIIELLPREDALRLSLTCWPLRDVALSIIHREISVSTTSNSIDYKLSLLRNPNSQKRVRTLNLKHDTPISIRHLQETLDPVRWILELLEFPLLKKFSLATTLLPVSLWHNLFVFLYRHPTLRTVKLDFHRCADYQNYDHMQDPVKLWAYITPGVLPSLRLLTVDAMFLSALARARVSSLENIQVLHIIDYCIGAAQDTIWRTIRNAELLKDVPVLIFTYLPTEIPLAMFEITQHIPFVFKNVKHLSTNLGEGQWTADGLMDVLNEFTRLWTLSIPVQIARDFMTEISSVQTLVQNPSQAPVLALPTSAQAELYTRPGDLAFRETAEAEKLAADMSWELREISPVQKIILHMPGWLPAKLPF